MGTNIDILLYVYDSYLINIIKYKILILPFKFKFDEMGTNIDMLLYVYDSYLLNIMKYRILILPFTLMRWAQILISRSMFMIVIY